MNVVGFTFVRNAVKLGYPIDAAIRSILPLCDKVIVLAGNSEDDTNILLEHIASDKIEIYHSVWDDSLRKGGQVLAQETDKALALVPKDTDWAIYIQADEVLPEKYHKNLLNTMLRYKDAPEVDGLLFDYLHFYGSYKYIADSRQWYRHEVRVIRPGRGIYAYRDAQGFRKGRNQKLRVRHSNAFIYHYGWVREPQKQQAKQHAFHRLYNSSEYTSQNQAFDYSHIDSLKLFTESHPVVMQKYIQQADWDFTHDISKKNYTLRVWFLMWIERLTGWRIGEYRNFRRLR
ncbi:glycosyl transferase [Eisenibacter elegans]|jgi:hypothetical protein|uniref:glycosyl transferase n=1 Tax=Eisenibacter elegans TaxID=997 RepID=UPI00041B7C98|nr:glycosyl transferase [Eisenibacter elegans]